jgi:predicted AAA+ superfamily ATPase
LLHAYLSDLEDAFLIRVIALHTASERQRMLRPRKRYPADPHLILVDERTRRPNLGHALETTVLVERVHRTLAGAVAELPKARPFAADP